MPAYEEARSMFDTYAGLDAPHLPPGLPALQVGLHRLCVHSPDLYGVEDSTFGLTSVIGVLAFRARRALPDREATRRLVAAAVVQATVHLVNLCTCHRLDFFTLVEEGLREYLQERRIA
jgi:hypothetical protein